MAFHPEIRPSLQFIVALIAVSVISIGIASIWSAFHQPPAASGSPKPPLQADIHQAVRRDCNHSNYDLRMAERDIDSAADNFESAQQRKRELAGLDPDAGHDIKARKQYLLSQDLIDAEDHWSNADAGLSQAEKDLSTLEHDLAQLTGSGQKVDPQDLTALMGKRTLNDLRHRLKADRQLLNSIGDELRAELANSPANSPNRR